MTLWVPKGSGEDETPDLPPPPSLPPEPTPEEIAAAQQLAKEINEKASTPGVRVALLEQDGSQVLIAEWLNVIIPRIFVQLSMVDRQQLLTVLDEAIEDEAIRCRFQGINWTFDRQTYLLIRNALVEIAKKLPPPVFQFQQREKGAPPAADPNEPKIELGS